MCLSFEPDSSVRAFWYVPGILFTISQEFGAYKLGGWNTGCTVAVAALNHLENTNPKLSAIIGKASMLFNVIGLTAVFWECGKLATVFDQRFHILERSRFWNEHTFCVLGWAGMMGWCYAAAVVVGCVNDYLAAKDKPPVSAVKWRHPLGEAVEEWLNVLRITANLALVVFSSSNRWSWAVNAAALGYNLLKITDRKWLVLDKDFDLCVDNVSRISFSYYCMLFPAKRDGSCVVCNQSEPRPNVQFCSDHVSHDTCIAARILEKEAGFAKGIRFLKYWIIRNCELEIKYSAAVLKQNMPCCTCGSEPVRQSVEIIVHDEEDGPINANVGFK